MANAPEVLAALVSLVAERDALKRQVALLETAHAQAMDDTRDAEAEAAAAQRDLDTLVRMHRRLQMAHTTMEVQYRGAMMLMGPPPVA